MAGLAGQDGAVLKWKMSTHSPLSLAAAEDKARAQQETRTSTPGSGAIISIRTDTVRVPSLSPVEDDLAHGCIDVGGGETWLYWGIFDGHSGWSTSTILRNSLAEYVGIHLRRLDRSDLHDPKRVGAAVESAFLQLDDEILSDAHSALYEDIPHAEAMCRIAPASSGSCATLVLLDPATSVTYVACVGDSRAVLGRRALGHREANKWGTIALSTDQTGYNQQEVARILAEHPGETPIDVASGRLLNCAVTRSFGDNRWKWPIEALNRWQNSYFGRNCLSDYHSPPYMTARPTVTSTQTRPGDFVILASDGFWNHMDSSDDAVHCAGMWIDAQSERGGKENMFTNQSGGSQPSPPPPVVNPQGAKSLDTGNRGDVPSPAGFPYNWTVKREHFVVEEGNIATHLVKNAFGGIQRDLFCSVMSTTAPDSKEARDDTTVIVILL